MGQVHFLALPFVLAFLALQFVPAFLALQFVPASRFGADSLILSSGVLLSCFLLDGYEEAFLDLV